MIYLDNAATSFPKPESVSNAVYGVMTRLGANPGRSGHRMSLAAGRIIMNCREALAELMQVPNAERVIFCFNCTDALNLALRGFLQQGDHVIATALDHNASLRPLSGMASKGMITLDILQPEDGQTVTPSQIERAINPQTRLVTCTHASNVTGAVQPVMQIGDVCKKHGVKLLVDAAQTIGILPVHPNVLGADMVAFPGHKALLGPTGTGALWIGEDVSLRPFREGGTGSQSESVLQPEDLPDRYESGTSNLSGIAGFLQGIRFVMQHTEDIAPHETELAHHLREGLENIKGVTVYGPQTPSLGVVSFNIEGKRSGEVADILNRYNIGIRSGLHCAPMVHRWLGTLETGAVRVSPGFFNRKSDIDRLLSVVERI